MRSAEQYPKTGPIPPTEFAAEFQRLRKRTNMSQYKFAKTAKVHPSSICRLENGTRETTQDFLESLIPYLDLSAEEADRLRIMGGFPPAGVGIYSPEIIGLARALNAITDPEQHELALDSIRNLTVNLGGTIAA